MTALLEIAQRVLIAGIICTFLEILLPEGRIRKTAVMACNILLVSAILGGVVKVGLPDPGSVGEYMEPSYDALELFRRNTAEQIKKRLLEFEGFSDCTVLVNAEESDYICRVTGIVIYCKGVAGRERDEEVKELLCSGYRLSDDQVRIAR